MKRTIDVNIGGFVFHLDEDAYEILNRYISSLEKHYGNDEDGKEIVNDIESRIAELLHERKPNEKDVVNTDDINYIKGILGNPEEIFDEDEAQEPNVIYKTAKKLYRDADNRILGGVMAGLAAYFGIPIALCRLLYIFFVLISFGAALLVYIVLWIAIPKALTSKQRLEMKGEPVNLSNIEKSIKEEYSEVKKNIDKQTPKVRKGINNFWDSVNSFFLGAGNVIVKILGISFILVGLVMLPVIFGMYFVADWMILPFTDIEIYRELPTLFFNVPNGVMFTICSLLVLLIPFVMLLFAGLKMLFRFKTNTSLIVIIMLALWFFGLINMALLAGGQVREYRTTNTEYSMPDTLKTFEGNTLHVKYINNRKGSRTNCFESDDMIITDYNGKLLLWGEPEIKLESSNSDNYEVVLRKKARGRNRENTLDNIENIHYGWELKDSVLYFDKYFTINGDQMWRDQEVDIILRVPKGKDVYMDKRTRRYFDVERDRNYLRINIHHKKDINIID